MLVEELTVNVSHLVLHARSDYAIYSCSYLAYLLHYIPTLTPNNSTEDGAYGMGENDMGQLGIGTNVGKGATVTTPKPVQLQQKVNLRLDFDKSHLKSTLKVLLEMCKPDHES